MRSGFLVEVSLPFVKSAVDGDDILTGLFGFFASPERSAGLRIALVRVACFRSGESQSGHGLSGRW